MRYADVRIVENHREDLSAAIARVVARLNAAGYDGDFDVLGAGMTSVVLRDLATGYAFKVVWAPEDATSLALVADEYEFLVSLENSRVAALLPRVYQFDALAGVLVREGIEGRPGGWGTRGLREVYDAITEEAKRYGWTRPEFKEDSFIVRDDGSIVMVDVGFAQRTGARLVRYVESVLGSSVVHPRRFYADLAFALRMDAADKLIPARVAMELQARMEQITGGSLG